jgi:hypothetical protein
MNDLLSWQFAAAVILALVGIAVAVLALASADDFKFAKGCFLLAALVAIARITIWGVTTTRGLTLRLVVCLISCGLIGTLAVLSVRYVNRKHARWLDVSQDSKDKAPQLVEERQEHEMPEDDMPSTDARPIAGIAVRVQEHKEQNTENLEPEPNIICLRVSDPFIELDGAGILHETNYGDDRSILAEFCNEPNPPRKIKSLDQVEAQIFYYNLKGYLELRVDHGCWLEEEWYSISLDANRVRKLLVGLVDGREFTIYDSNHESLNRYLPPTQLTLVDFRGFDIQVHLVGGAHAEWTKDFWFELKLNSDKLFVFRPTEPKPELATLRGEKVILINADSES